jgi:hypothetical protein
VDLPSKTSRENGEGVNLILFYENKECRLKLGWIDMAQDTDSWRALVNMIMSVLCSITAQLEASLKEHSFIKLVS